MKIINNSTENSFKSIKNDKNLPVSAEISQERDLKLKAQAEEMEAIFLSKLVKTMEKTVPKSNSKNSLSSMMFSSEMGKAMAKAGGIGLSKMIYNSLKEKNEDLSNELLEINQQLNQDKSQMIEMENKGM